MRFAIRGTRFRFDSSPAWSLTGFEIDFDLDSLTELSFVLSMIIIRCQNLIYETVVFDPDSEF